MPRSLAATWGISFDFFSSGYLDVSVHRVPFPIRSNRDDSTAAAGLLHSDICGSTPTCGSPQLFAANRVLHRLISPRHPPYALCILTFVSNVSLRSVFSCITRVSFFFFFCVVFKEQCGGDEENRTPDPLLARQVLSQLSYTPTSRMLYRVRILLYTVSVLDTFACLCLFRPYSTFR